jgi:hypothetical protein
VAFATAFAAAALSHTFHNFTRRHPSFQMTETQQQIEEKNCEKRKRSVKQCIEKPEVIREKIKIIISLD